MHACIHTYTLPTYEERAYTGALTYFALGTGYWCVCVGVTLVSLSIEAP